MGVRQHDSIVGLASTAESPGKYGLLSPKPPTVSPGGTLSSELQALLGTAQDTLAVLRRLAVHPPGTTTPTCALGVETPAEYIDKSSKSPVLGRLGGVPEVAETSTRKSAIDQLDEFGFASS
jgi:hypothetical protein